MLFHRNVNIIAMKRFFSLNDVSNFSEGSSVAEKDFFMLENITLFDYFLTDFMILVNFLFN